MKITIDIEIPESHIDAGLNYSMSIKFENFTYKRFIDLHSIKFNGHSFSLESHKKREERILYHCNEISNHIGAMITEKIIRTENEMFQKALK